MSEDIETPEHIKSHQTPSVAASENETALLSRRPFMIMWTGQAFSIFGSQLVRFAIVWWLTVETGSPAVLAGASMMILIPQVIISPFAGSYVDRWNRKRTIMVSDALVAIGVAVLTVFFLIDRVDIWIIFFITFLSSMVGAFHQPALSATTTLMVRREDLARIGGLNQALNGAVSIIAPPMGAILLYLLPIYGVLAIDIITATIAILAIAVVHVPQPPQKDEGEETSVLTDLKEGLAFIKGWPGALRLIGMAMIINFTITPAMTLLPILATSFFIEEAAALAALAAFQTAISFGSVVGGMIIGAWGVKERKLITSLSGIFFVGIGLSIIGFTPLSNAWFVVFALLMMGVSLAFANGPLQAILQSTIPPEMQGRVFAVLATGALMMNPIGLAFAGPIAELFGVQFLFIIAGTITMLAAVGGYLSPSLREFEAHAEKVNDRESESVDYAPKSEIFNGDSEEVL